MIVPRKISSCSSALAIESTLLPSDYSFGIAQAISNRAIFGGSVINIDGSNSSDNFNAAEVLAIAARIEIDPADVGSSGNIYCIIVYQGAYYAMNSNGSYQAWNGDPVSLPAMEATTFGSIENISIAEQLTQTAGEFAIYIAYDTGDGVLRYNSAPIQFSVN